jgi:hypothetical protein
VGVNCQLLCKANAWTHVCFQHDLNGVDVALVCCNVHGCVACIDAAPVKVWELCLSCDVCILRHQLRHHLVLLTVHCVVQGRQACMVALLQESEHTITQHNTTAKE